MAEINSDSIINNLGKILKSYGVDSENVALDTLTSIFNACKKNKNNSVDIEVFADEVLEYYGIECDSIEDDWLSAFGAIAGLDGNADEISYGDISTLNYDSDEWEDVKYTQDTGIFGSKKDSYTYTSDDGTTIQVSVTDGVTVKRNSEMGKIVIIGAQGASITSGSSDTSITICDSKIDSIKTKKGNDELEIYNSTVGTIETGKGIDSITIENSTIEDINTGSGSDIINASNSTISEADTSSEFLFGILDSGEDTLIFNNVKANKIKTGKGDDTVIAENSSVDTLKTGKGEDLLSLNKTDVKNLGINKKDIAVEDGNYLDFDTSVISDIKSDAKIAFSDGTTMNISEYIDCMLNQEVGYETEEEYYKYVVDTLTSTLETMQSVLSSQNDADGAAADTYNILKELTGLGITSSDAEGMIAEMKKMAEGLSAALSGESSMSFEEAYEYYMGVTYSQEKLDTYMEVSNVYSALLMGCRYDEDYAEKFEEATGKSLEDIASEYALCQTETFGNVTTLENLTEAYSEDQETFADKLSSVISVSGIALTVTGAVLCMTPAYGVGIAIMTAGKYTALSGMFVDNAIDLVDDSTDADGLTSDELFDIALETGVEAASYLSGRAIGGFTNSLNSMVASQAAASGAGGTLSYIAGQAAETGVDTVMSLAADYGITNVESLITTGETVALDEFFTVDNLLGEGRSQLIGIITGLAASKLEANKASAAGTALAAGVLEASDGDTVKTNNINTVKTGDVDITKTAEVTSILKQAGVKGEIAQRYAEYLITMRNELIESMQKDGYKREQTVKAVDKCITQKIGIIQNSKKQGASDDLAIKLARESCTGNTIPIAVKLEQSGYLNSSVYMAPYATVRRICNLFESNPKKFNELANSGFFELVNSGYISSEKLENLFIYSTASIGENITFSDRTLDEISRLKAQVDAGIEDPYSRVKQIDSNDIQAGDVLEQDGKLYVLETGGTVSELGISKKTFDELFPLLSSSFNQGHLGDCWLVSAIDNMLDNPQGRAEVYKLFTETSDGITVTFQGAQPVTFLNGEVLDASGKQISGSKGIAMLEQAFAVHRNNLCTSVTTNIADFTDIDSLMNKLNSGTGREGFSMIFSDINIKYYDLYSVTEAEEIIKNKANNADNLICIAFEKEGAGREGVIDKSLSLHACHAYSLKAYDNKTDTVYLTNPWNTSTLIAAPLETLKQYFLCMTVGNF